MTWRVARSLDVLLAEINAAAPNRSKISDGSIGDAAHASRTSDHNPWVTVGGVGIVRARDFTHDPSGGCDGYKLAPALAALLRRHPALGSGAYVIWQRRIISADRLAEGWRYYSGSNPHDHHVHLSVATAASGFDNTTRWGVMAPADTEEDEIMGAADDITKAIKAQGDRIVSALDGLATKDQVGSLRQKEAQRHAKTIREMRDQGKSLDEIAAAVEADGA